MLRGNAKIWAIVVLICIVAQFFTMSLPGIIETFGQMNIEFACRAEEERAKATEPTVDNAVVNTEESGCVENEKVDDGLEVVEDTSALQEGESEKGSAKIFTIIQLIIVVFFTIVLIFFLLS